MLGLWASSVSTRERVSGNTIFRIQKTNVICLILRKLKYEFAFSSLERIRYDRRYYSSNVGRLGTKSVMLLKQKLTGRALIGGHNFVNKLVQVRVHCLTRYGQILFQDSMQGSGLTSYCPTDCQTTGAKPKRRVPAPINLSTSEGTCVLHVMIHRHGDEAGKLIP